MNDNLATRLLPSAPFCPNLTNFAFYEEDRNFTGANSTSCDGNFCVTPQTTDLWHIGLALGLGTGINVRQLRVRPKDFGDAEGVYMAKFSQLYPPYSADVEEKAPFGPGVELARGYPGPGGATAYRSALDTAVQSTATGWGGGGQLHAQCAFFEQILACAPLAVC